MDLWTPYQVEQVAAFIGDFGFVAMMVGYCIWFVYKGCKRQ